MPDQEQVTEPLRRLHAHEVILDHPLPGHLRDAEGHILLRAGQKLSPAKLSELERRHILEFYAGDDWPSAPAAQADHELPASTDELTAALRRRRATMHDSGQFRSTTRFVWKTRLRLRIQEGDHFGTRDRQIDVETADVSVRGFAFVYDQYLHAGTIVIARLEMLPRPLVVKAVVRGCHLIGGRQHRLGCQFVEVMPSDALN